MYSFYSANQELISSNIKNDSFDLELLLDDEKNLPKMIVYTLLNKNLMDFSFLITNDDVWKAVNVFY